MLPELVVRLHNTGADQHLRRFSVNDKDAEQIK
jgi:hypothetical protein